MSIGSRIKDLRELNGISRNEFASMLGVTVGAISNYENDVSSPKEPILFKIIESLNCDANYIFQDSVKIKTQQNDVTLAEYEHIKKYRGLDDHGKEIVDYALDKETERIQKFGRLGESSNTTVPFPKRLISYYFKNASAGTGQLVIDNLPDKDIEIPDKPEYRNVSYAIGVNGSSMEPAFQDGDILLVEATQEIEVGDVGIFQINNECFVKKLGEKELISLNKDYKNIPLDETALTLGKVIGKL